jgi:hypothetical protein
MTLRRGGAFGKSQSLIERLALIWESERPDNGRTKAEHSEGLEACSIEKEIDETVYVRDIYREGLIGLAAREDEPKKLTPKKGERKGGLRGGYRPPLRSASKTAPKKALPKETKRLLGSVSEACFKKGLLLLLLAQNEDNPLHVIFV